MKKVSNICECFIHFLFISRHFELYIQSNKNEVIKKIRDVFMWRFLKLPVQITPMTRKRISHGLKFSNRIPNFNSCTAFKNKPVVLYWSKNMFGCIVVCFFVFFYNCLLILYLRIHVGDAEDKRKVQTIKEIVLVYTFNKTWGWLHKNSYWLYNQWNVFSSISGREFK